MLQEVFITKLSKFLPNEPLGFDDNGIKTRYSELKKDGSITHNNPELVHEALKGLEGNGFNLKEIEVLSCGTSLKKGEKKLIILPESARFSFAYSLLTVV